MMQLQLLLTLKNIQGFNKKDQRKVKKLKTDLWSEIQRAFFFLPVCKSEHLKYAELAVSTSCLQTDITGLL